MNHYAKVLKRCVFGAAMIGCAGAAYEIFFLYFDRKHEKKFYKKFLNATKSDVLDLNLRPTSQLPLRSEILQSLQETDEFDVLVIGGGATGSGVALDSQTRGLKTALVEMDDFSSGTSSRSTKLIHGGVRYLRSALMKLDMEQYRMVKEALFERANLLAIAPHLSYPLPIMLPIYKWWHIPYFWAGIKMYDFVSGKRVLKHSYYIRKSKALELFPMLKRDSLKGALIYFDGQHNDARMNLCIVLTAIRCGAQCANHVQVTSLLKNEGGKVCGACVKDVLSDQEWDIKAKCVINATGPFTDEIRLMDNPSAEKICAPSQGVHIVLPGYYSPSNTGLLDPETSDGRVIFFLPWEKATVAGTTDSPCEITHSPAPEDRDVEFILSEVRSYLSPEISVRRGDVLSAWAGLRPLVRDPSKKDTKSIARNHIIEINKSNLVTIAGGKWTTYRHMAEETVDAAVKACGLKPVNGCVTGGLLLEGAHEWNPLLYISLVQDYGLEVDVAHHLSETYGDRAYSVAKLAKLTGKRWPVVGIKVHPEFPYLEAEIIYAVRREYACTAIDVLARRFRLAFLNTWAAEECLPKIVEVMAKEVGWDKNEQIAQLNAGKQFLERDMGKQARARAIQEAPLSLTRYEMDRAKERFQQLDKDRKGYITVNDLRRHFRERGEKVDEKLLHELLDEIDLKKNGQVDLMEFLQLYSGLKGGQVTQIRIAKYLEMETDSAYRDRGLKKSPVLSGGGV